MDKIVQPCKPVVGSSFGQTATLDLPPGMRRHVLWLEIIAKAANGVTLSTANLGSLVDLITLKINGKPQRMHTAMELDAINTSYGVDFAANAYDWDAANNRPTYANGTYKVPQAGNAGGTTGITVFYLPIFFAEPWRKSLAAQESFAWYTAWQDGSALRSFQVEFRIPAQDNNTFAGSAITINCFEEVDNALGPLDSNKQPVAVITKWLRNATPYAAAGDLYITDLPKQDVYLQISAFQATDDIYRATVKVDSRIVRDVTKPRNDQTLLARGMNEAALAEKNLHIIFDYSDVPTDGLVMQAGSQQVKDFQVILNMACAAPNTLSLVSQVYGGID